MSAEYLGPIGGMADERCVLCKRGIEESKRLNRRIMGSVTGSSRYVKVLQYAVIDSLVHRGPFIESRGAF